MLLELDGQSVYVNTGGEAHSAGAPVICFIHGAAMDHTVWTLFARYWAKRGFNAMAVDLPGHGLSTGDPLPRIEENAQLLQRLVDTHIPDSSVYWVGHSMGSLIALECARIVNRSKALVMMGTAFPMAVGSPLLDSARANQHMAIDIVSLFGHSYGSQLGGNPVAGIHAQTLAERLMEQVDDDGMYTDLNACHQYDQGEATAARINCPSYLILAELDRMTPPRAARSLIDNLPAVTVHSLSDCGHMMMTEQPEQTHRALLASIEAAAGPELAQA
ncbi:MAG: alpha/beta hydrolase [Pseudomonadota bacterium]